jgi:hypothetical protein
MNPTTLALATISPGICLSDNPQLSDLILTITIKTYLTPPQVEPYFVIADTTVTTCSGTFYDPGFKGAYSNSGDYIQTFKPAFAVNKLLFSFSTFELAPQDYLYIYDGTTVNSPLIGVFSANTSSPNTIISSNPTGALIFRFVTDSYGVASGWTANITCVNGTLNPPFFGALWNKRFGGEGYDQLNTAIQTKDGGYLLGGISLSGISGDKSQEGRGDSDYWIVKIDSKGTKQWDKRFGGLRQDVLKAMVQTENGGYLLTGDSFSGIGGDKTQKNYGPATGAGFYSDFWVIKIDSLGNKLWDKTFGGDYTENINYVSITEEGN